MCSKGQISFCFLPCLTHASSSPIFFKLSKASNAFSEGNRENICPCAISGKSKSMRSSFPTWTQDLVPWSVNEILQKKITWEWNNKQAFQMDLILKTGNEFVIHRPREKRPDPGSSCQYCAPWAAPRKSLTTPSEAKCFVNGDRTLHPEGLCSLG